ncbi:MAG TPA: TrkA family potassium uptake protein [Candidatus Cybelea sp.]|jgi:voltage-gated potassium channel|nr:TrkA family potassium uptake protein [Candidatus Cybelea sp.]
MGLRGSLGVAIALLAAVIVVGTFGYVELEGWHWFDAFYMTITTITTIGGGEPRSMDVSGKWWTIGVVAIGFGVLTYTLLRLLTYTLEGRLGTVVGERRMRRRVAEMTGHYILCGFGRVGGEIAQIFTDESIEFVVIDINQDSLARAAAAGFRTVTGDAAETETLRAAGVDRARGLVAAVDSDEINIYVTLSARVLNPNIFIVARANRDDAESKLRLAGATQIISPYQMGGRRMASLAMRPTAVEFVDTVLFAKNSQLVLEDFRVAAGSRWIGKALSAAVPDGDDVVVLALKRAERMLFRPPPATRLEDSDEIVAAGPPEGIRALDERLRSG